MELQINRDNVCINETVFSGNVEQGIEIDYMLPDYCKSIFKVLKAVIEPKITSMRISGDKLNIDAMATARIIYVSEEDSSVCAVTQKQAFSKTVELGCECDSPEIISSAKTDYTNCRVVNNKHIDLRGAVTISVEIIKPKCTQAVTDASGMGIQLKRDEITVSDENKFAIKQFSVMQSMDIPYGKPEFAGIISCSSSSEAGETKIIAGKVITKGEVTLHILYTPQSDDSSPAPETMDVMIPVSQIVDLPGIDEEYSCVVNFDVCSAEISESEEQNSIDAELVINVTCTGYKNRPINIVTDAYSTKFIHSAENSKIKANCFLGNISDMFVVKNNIETDSSGDIQIIDCLAELKSCAADCKTGEITVSGTADVCLLIIGADGMPSVIEKNVPFEQSVKAPTSVAAAKAKIAPQIASCSYSMQSDSIEIRFEIKLSGCLVLSAEHNLLCDISVDEERPKENHCPAALTLYFAEDGERIWDIAKKYNTNVQAVTEENDLDGGIIAHKTMLLIPITE